MFFLAGVDDVPREKQSESPFFLLGKLVMQQSYVCALIAMMVTTRKNNRMIGFNTFIDWQKRIQIINKYNWFPVSTSEKFLVYTSQLYSS